MSSANPCARCQVLRPDSARDSGLTDDKLEAGAGSLSALWKPTLPPDSNHLHKAGNPSRCASSGIVPPTENGSSTFGNSPSHDASISARASSLLGVLPNHQPLQDPEQPPPLYRLTRLRREPVRMSRRIIHERSPQHRPGSCQRPRCPPQLQRRRMPMPGRLLPRRRRADHIQRQRHLNQLPLVPHPLTISRNTPSIDRPGCDSPYPAESNPLEPVRARHPARRRRAGLNWRSPSLDTSTFSACRFVLISRRRARLRHHACDSWRRLSAPTPPGDHVSRTGLYVYIFNRTT